MKPILVWGGKDAYKVPPWYYGFAYDDPSRDGYVLAIIPLNLIIQIFRWIKYRKSNMDMLLRQTYKAGYDEGCKSKYFA